MRPVDEYKRNAIECIRLAAELTDPDSRAAMLNMAQAWSRLADQAGKTYQPAAGYAESE